MIFPGTTSGMPSLLSVQRTSWKREPHLVPAGPARKTGSRPVVRGGKHDALAQVAGIKGLDVYAMMGGKIVDHALSLETLGFTSNCTVSFFLRLRGGSRENVLGQWTCTTCFAERCWPARVRRYRCGELRNNDSAPWNAKKGKALRALWVVLLQKDPALCRPRQAIGHMLCDRVELHLGLVWGAPLLPFLMKTWSTHSSSSRVS